MKDFWKFFGKLAVALVFVVLVIVLVKKIKTSESSENDDSQHVYHYPSNVGRQGLKLDYYTTETRLPLPNQNVSSVFAKTLANLAKDLTRMESRVTSQERSLNRSIVQTNENISYLREKLNSLSSSLSKTNGKNDTLEDPTAKSKEVFRFPFAPLDNSCYEPFNMQVHANDSKFNATKNIQTPTVISRTTSRPEDTNNMDIGDNKLTAATCVLIIQRPSIPLDTKINLRKANEDYRISVAGVIPAKSLQFIIDICIDTKILLHINPKFGEGKIILNSHDTYWDESKEIYAALNGMYPGNKFQIVVTLQNAIFQIEVNNGEANLFENRINDTISLSRHVRIRGDVIPSLLTYELLDDPSSTVNSSLSDNLLTFPFML